MVENTFRRSAYLNRDRYLCNYTISNMDILGYTRREDGVWETIEPAKHGYIYTQAFILCSQCNKAIRPQGGPRYNSYCLDCYEKVREL